MAGSRLRRALLVPLATVAMLAATLAGSAAAGTTVSTGPDPVVIVAGTGGPGWYYEALRTRLQDGGHRVWIFQLTDYGMADIRYSARDLGRLVASIRGQTGAARVDLVGHSQGGLVSRHYVKYLGGDATVDSAIMFGAPNHGSLAANLAELFTLGTCLGIVSCEQMTVGSDYLAALNAGDDTYGPVEYTSIYTVHDEVVVPYTSAIMADGASNVKVQAQCPYRYVEHIAGIHDGTVASGILDALAHRPVTLDCWAW